jgi:proteasome accessory factor B
MAPRKVERLINLVVMLLETRKPVSVETIHQTIPGYGQENYESFKRMFERDKEELREMGIPIELIAVDNWGEEEGYRIPKERYYLPDLELQPDEVASLWIAAGLMRMSDEGAARSAIMKLSSDSHLDPAAGPAWLAADLGLALPNLPRAFESVSERKSVEFAYRKAEGKPRHLDPYGLVHRKGVWYVVGLDYSSAEVRSFRLDRIVGDLRFVEPSKPGPEFDIPEGFDPARALEAPPFAQGDSAEIKATVSFDASTAWWVERSAPWLHLEWQEDSIANAVIEVSDITGFVSWLLSYGEGATLISPDDLKMAVRTRLEEICV